MGISLRILCLVTLGLFLYSCATTPVDHYSGPAPASEPPAPPAVAPETAAAPEAAMPPEAATAPEGIASPEIATPPEVATPPESIASPEITAPPEAATAPEGIASPEITTAPEAAEPSGPDAAPAAIPPPEAIGLDPPPEIARAEPESRPREQIETLPAPPESALKEPQFPEGPQLAAELPKAGPERPESPPARTPLSEPSYPERPEPPPAPEYILGEGRVSLSDLKYFLLTSNPGMDPAYIEDLSRFYIEEAASEGVNHDIAFAQMCLETGYLRYGGLVTPDMNNFCGLGAIGPGQRGEYFPSPRIGVRAHIQHLKVYATDAPLRQELVDPRYHWVRPGAAPTLDGLAGTWARDLQYATKIRSILARLYNFSFQLDESRTEQQPVDSEIPPESFETGSVIFVRKPDFQINYPNSPKTY